MSQQKKEKNNKIPDPLHVHSQSQSSQQGHYTNLYKSEREGEGELGGGARLHAKELEGARCGVLAAPLIVARSRQLREQASMTRLRQCIAYSSQGAGLQ